MDPWTGKAWGDRCPALEAGRRHGSWYLRLELPVGPDGRRRRVRRGGFTTRKAAEEALAQLQMPSDAGCGLVTVGEWLTHWPATRTGAATTISGHAGHVRLYLAPYLGTVVLAELSVAHLQAMFARIAREHRARGVPLTAATVNRIRATLRTALNAALRRGLISGNPAARIELPTARRPRAVVWTAERVRHWQRTGERPAVAVWTAAQTAEFLDAIKDHPLYAAYHLIALRGLRRGEAVGLRWCDVDLEHGVAVISQQIQQHQGLLAVCPPKTAGSARVIALDRTTVTALRAHRVSQRKERKQAGEGYQDSELKVVQDMLGHSSIVLTADTCTSVLPEVAHRAAEMTAAHVMKARGVVPGTNRTCRRTPSRKKRRRSMETASRSSASTVHPARQLGRPQRR
ncbi:site-specific integrase [Actinomadura verrucosospora]|uniref:site-specific integrase n=1 Tax=Actinomadura verrucosospora TaxID=46165 RepID=UPI001567192B|nr:site-specific integrase [Actinomadura verrucosospora]